MTENTGTAPKHEITQICIVVRDIERSMKEYTERLGWGPWKVFEYGPPLLHDTHLRGEPAEFTMIGAETMVGGIGFELIQPTGGDSIYQEFLDRHGEGVQHIAIMKHSKEESDELIADVGAASIMGGSTGADIEFYYLDTQDTLGVTIESGTGHAIDIQPTRVVG
ncbi:MULTISPECIES: VOC family protein [unclassified Microbacterium]|uniref:VOC family protein n=1 Tax=unclassified Microbacterium TaxID=2609290 RepID=UPI0022F0DC77|nr:VOC family protein [Streptomyces sp. MS2A]